MQLGRAQPLWQPDTDSVHRRGVLTAGTQLCPARDLFLVTHMSHWQAIGSMSFLELFDFQNIGVWWVTYKAVNSVFLELKQIGTKRITTTTTLQRYPSCTASLIEAGPVATDKQTTRCEQPGRVDVKNITLSMPPFLHKNGLRGKSYNKQHCSIFPGFNYRESVFLYVIEKLEPFVANIGKNISCRFEHFINDVHGSGSHEIW